MKAKKTSNSHFSDEIYFIEANEMKQSLLLLEISFSYPDGVVEIYYIACICSKHLLQ